MKSKIGLIFALAGLLTATACGDDGGGVDPDPGNPALVSVFPADGLSNRTATVSIIGTDTAWTDASTIDFGAGVTVDNVMSAGPNGLIVDLTIAGDATIGAHDVSVTDATGTTTLMAGFTVQEVLSVTITGNASQGGAPQVEIINNDPLNPFDLGFDPMTGAPNLLLEFSDPSVNVFNLVLEANRIEFLMATDIFAVASVDFIVTNGVAAPIVDTVSFDITPVTPKPLTVGTDIVEALAGPFDSAVYSYTATDLETVTFAGLANNGDPETADPLVFLFDSRGSYVGGFGLVATGLDGSMVIDPADQGFIVVFDFSGSGPITVTLPNSITDTILAGNTVAHDDAVNGDPANPQIVAALPGGYIKGSFADAVDEDWFQVTVVDAAANDLSIVTSGGGGGDTVIDVFLPGDTVNPIATSTDLAFFDSLTVTQADGLVNGAILVRITPSTFAPPDPLDSDYRAIAREI